MRSSGIDKQGPTRRALLQTGMAAGFLAFAPSEAQAQALGPKLGKAKIVPPSAGAKGEIPITHGFSAPAGAVPAGTGLLVRAGNRTCLSQCDWINRWPDGSLRFGIISALLPAEYRGGESEIDIHGGGAATTAEPGVSPSDLAAFIESQGDLQVEWRDRNGAAYSAKASSALRAASGWRKDSPCLLGRWLSGPVATEWICTAPMQGDRGAHPSLRIYFHCRVWRGAQGIVGAKVDVVFDNALGPQTPAVQEIVGDAIIRRGQSVVWQRLGRPLPPLTADSLDGKPVRNVKQSVQISLASDSLQPDDRFMTIDCDGTVLHLFEIAGPRQAIGRILSDEDLIVQSGKRDSAGVLPINGSAAFKGIAYLHQSCRVKIAPAQKQSISGLQFRVAGRDRGGNALQESIAIGPTGTGMGRLAFAMVERVEVDGPTNGTIHVGTAALGSLTCERPRLWGMSLAPWTRWPVPVVFGTAAAEAIPDPHMFMAARLLPNYAPELKSKLFAGYAKRLTSSLAAQTDSRGYLFPNSRDSVAPAYSALNVVLGGAQPGGRPDLAVVPGQQVAWLQEWQDPALFSVVLATGTNINNYPWHWRDEQTGLPLDPARHPRFTTHSNEPDDLKPPHSRLNGNSLCDMATDPEHWIEFNYLPFLTTGSLQQYEALHQACFAAWAWHPSKWPYLSANDGYRRGIVTTNARSMAWIMRNLGHARLCGPDKLADPGVSAPRSILDNIYAAQQEWLKKWYIDGPDLDGLTPQDHGTHRVLRAGGKPEYAYAPWMHNYASAVFGHLAEANAFDGNGLAFFDWFKRYTVDQVDPAQTHPAAAARLYYCRARYADGRPIASMKDMYTCMSEQEWPQPSSGLFVALQPNARLSISGDARRAGSIVTIKTIDVNTPKPRPVFAAELAGRQLLTLPDGGLATILRVLDIDSNYGSAIETRIERPFQANDYAQGSWRLQLPKSGPSSVFTLDPTREIGDYPYYVLGALACLAGAGTDGASESWARMHRLAQASQKDFLNTRPDLCGWAIAPRSAK